ncbi:hypothetical protein LJC05_04880 [Bacteroides sp. OttesenSCG-928-J23]|nr:hypothetical protein [Bacteroides sp. OttesenSCG-928-N06]MDL2248042.1 hypothetical protein [Bacteroides sp. OttesenSCG-928-J23]MDL2305927.1 hypothetical protein [Bacteroides sp. OttesenSCG-928-D19]
MKRINSVISLIYSMSKSEKKHFSLQVIKDGADKDYLLIYDIISKDKQLNGNSVKEDFYKRRPNGSFEVSIQYLYEKLLDTLLTLRKKKDIYVDLCNNICKARMLYERSLFYECFEILENTIELAEYYENHEILLMAIKLELEYLLRLNFPKMTEQELYHKHFQQNDALKKIRKITEQSSLYNLLKHRISRKGSIRTPKQKQDLNDLMVNELYIAASSDSESNFELTKNHKLFQANYLIAVGEYMAALNSFKELNKLFEANEKFWSNPPIYYLMVLEGVLDSLRSVGNYDEMPYFLNKLRKLATHSSLEFNVNATGLLYQYELSPHLDKGDFARCIQLMADYKESLYDKESWLNPIRRSELLLYTSIIYIGDKNYKAARKYITSTILDHNIDYLPIMRTIRLIRLIAYYETREYDLIVHESRSLKRGMSLKKEQSFKTEHTVLWFLNKHDLPVLRKDREAFWKKNSAKIEELRNDKFENQLLRIFDFTAWIESKILKEDLSEVLARRYSAKQ